MPVAAGVVRDLRMAARRVLAACDVPPERCRATALDRTHHLQLPEAHMPLKTPRFSGRGLSIAITILSTGYRPLGSCLPRSGLERSDFVQWHFSDVAGLTDDVRSQG